MQPAQIKLHIDENFLHQAKIQPLYFAGQIKKVSGKLNLTAKRIVDKTYFGLSSVSSSALPATLIFCTTFGSGRLPLTQATETNVRVGIMG